MPLLVHIKLQVQKSSLHHIKDTMFSKKKDSVTPEIVRKQSLKERKPTGGPTRNPHRGTLKRTPSQTSLSSDEGDGGRKNPPPRDGKKIHVSMERLQEMEQREKLYLAKIEELTTRLKI